MTIFIRSTHCVVLKMKQPRIGMPPTQFQKFAEYFKIEFSGNNFDIPRKQNPYNISISYFVKLIS